MFGRSCSSGERSAVTETLGAVAPRGCRFCFALRLALFSRIWNMLTLSGSVCSQHAFIRIDAEQARSVVSSVFVGQHALPETVLVRSSVAYRSTSGPVVVPTSAGLYSCCFPMDVGHLSGADVCLGRDWLSACSIELHGLPLQDPSHDAISRFPVGFSWERRDGTSVPFFFLVS